MHEHFRAFEVTQEPVAEAETAVCAFDETRHVGDDEAAVVAQPHDAEIGRQRRERIIRDLRPRRGHPGNERRFAGIGESDEPDVGEQLQLEPQIFFFARLARLHLARRAIG